MKLWNRIIVWAVISGLVAALFDAVLDYGFFYSERSLSQLFSLNIPVREVYTRFVIIGSFTLFGIVLSWMLGRHEQVEQSLRESQHRFRVLYERMPLGYQSLNIEGRYIEVNQAWQGLLGYSREEVIGRWFGDFVVPEQRGRLRQNFERFIAAGEARGVEYDMLHKDGSRLTVAIDGRIGYDEHGQFKQTHCVLYDRTEEQRAWDVLERDAEINAMLAELSQLLLETRPIEAISAGVLNTAQQITGSTIGYVGYIDPDTGYLVCPTMVGEVWDKCDVSGKDIVFEEFGGLWGWVLDHHAPLLSNDITADPRSAGTPQGHVPVERFLSVPAMIGDQLVGQIALANSPRDYTPQDLSLAKRLAVLYALAIQRARIDEALRQSEHEKSLLLGSISEMVAYYRDESLEIVWANRAASQSVGMELGEIVGLHCHEVWHVAAEPCECCPVQAVFETGEAQTMEQTTPDGRIWLLRAYPVRDDDGRLMGVVEVGLEITGRKQAEQALQAEKARAQQYLDIAGVMIVVLDPDGSIALINQHGAELLGYAEDELIGRNWFDTCVPPDDREMIRQVFDHVITGQVAPYEYYENYLLTKSGEKRLFAFNNTVLRDEDGSVIATLGSADDITERDRAEKALQQYAARLGVLHEIDQVILAAKSSRETAEAAVNRIQELVPFSLANVLVLDEEAQEAVILATSAGGPAEYTSGTRIPLALLGSLDNVIQSRLALVQDLHTMPNPSPMATHISALGLRSYASVPMLVEQQLIGLLTVGSYEPDVYTPEHIAVLREVADQLAIAIRQAELHAQVQQYAGELEQRVAERTAELEAANAQLRVLSQVKDEFVSNVTHELKTPITSIKLRQHLLAVQPEKLDEHVAVLRRETNRLDGIIESLLYLSRLDQGRIEGHVSPVNLNDLVVEYTADRQPVAQNRGLQLAVRTLPQAPVIEVDEVLLGQVLSVLLTNALNYTPPGGLITLSTLHRRRDGQVWYGVGVEDTGPGIQPDEKAQLFDRFFRGRAGQESGMPGTGLGLAIVKEIVEQHSGQVEVESSGVPGEGATFCVWLPG